MHVNEMGIESFVTVSCPITYHTEVLNVDNTLTNSNIQLYE